MSEWCGGFFYGAICEVVLTVLVQVLVSLQFRRAVCTRYALNLLSIRHSCYAARNAATTGRTDSDSHYLVKDFFACAVPKGSVFVRSFDDSGSFCVCRSSVNGICQVSCRFRNFFRSIC